MKLRSTKTRGEQASAKIKVVKAQSGKEELANRAPPRVGTPIQTTLKTCIIHRSLQETIEAEQEFK
jgi:hypothetical protein